MIIDGWKGVDKQLSTNSMITVGLIVSAQISTPSFLANMEKGDMCLDGNYPSSVLCNPTCLLRNFLASSHHTHNSGDCNYLGSLGWLSTANLYQNCCSGVGRGGKKGICQNEILLY